MPRGHARMTAARTVLRAACCCVTLAWLLGGCSAETPAPLRIATNNWPGYWPLYLARSAGKLDARLQELSSASEVLRAFRNHRVDVAAFTIEEFLQLLDEGNEPFIALVIDYSNGADSVIARPPYTSVAALRGRVIGTESTAMGAYVLRRTLASAGLKESDVKPVAFDSADHESAYMNGQVDAIVTFEPTRSRLLAAGGHEVFSSASMPGEVADVLVVTANTARQRAPELRKLIATWYAAADSMRTQPRAAADQLAGMTKLTHDQFEQALQGMHLVTPGENQALLHAKFGDILEQVAHTMSAAGMLTHTYSADELRARFIKLAQP